jgi:hypothetical protein
VPPSDRFRQAAETRFWIEWAEDEETASRKEAEDLVRGYLNLGFMIHKLWKEWRKL